jgi:hypothetical protein
MKFPEVTIPPGMLRTSTGSSNRDEPVDVDVLEIGFEFHKLKANQKVRSKNLLNIAIEANKERFFNLLLDDPNVDVNYGSPLTATVNANKPAMFLRLLSYPAIEITNGYKRTPYQMAVEGTRKDPTNPAFQEIARLLLENGAEAKEPEQATAFGKSKATPRDRQLSTPSAPVPGAPEIGRNRSIDAGSSLASGKSLEVRPIIQRLRHNSEPKPGGGDQQRTKSSWIASGWGAPSRTPGASVSCFKARGPAARPGQSGTESGEQANGSLS